MVRAWVKAMGFSRGTICRETGIHNSTIRHLFRGDLRRMDRPTRLRLAHFVGCEPEELFK